MYLPERLESKFTHFEARDYNPGLGRFISEDPIGLLSGDVNLYRYVKNDPFYYTDPSGKDAVIVTVLVNGVIPHSYIAVSTPNQGVVYFEFGATNIFGKVASLFGFDVDGVVKTHYDNPYSDNIVLESEYFYLSPEEDNKLLQKLLRKTEDYDLYNNNCFDYTEYSCSNICK